MALPPMFVNLLKPLAVLRDKTCTILKTFACNQCFRVQVFTMTALIDVVGRAHNAACARWLFGRMHAAHGLRPNVVTLVRQLHS